MIDIIELVETNLQTMLDSGEIECPSERCDSRRFGVSIRRDEEDSFVGDAVCRCCGQRVELDLDDGPVERAEATLEALQAQGTPDPVSGADSGGGETAD